MNKKIFFVKTLPDEDLKGFEEYIDGQSNDTHFLPRGNAAKKDVSFEHFTFLTNDSSRLTKLKDLLMDKLPLASNHEQGEKLIQNQEKEILLLKKNLFDQFSKPKSAYRKSIQEIFDSFFSPPQS
jgi:hypothetical protein